MVPNALAARLGFDVARLRFVLPTAAAATLALVLAFGLGLEHPQWSAMTVWAASQPSRGQLIEKSFFRFLGTVSGTIAGVVLVLVSVDSPWVLVVGLASWIALCAGIGNVQRGFVSYGTMLAGYSAAMVALLDTSHPTHVFALGLDRLTTVLVGVVVALCVGWFVSPMGTEDEIVSRVRRLTARILRDIAGLRRHLPRRPGNEQQHILAEMAMIEDGLEPHGAGSLRSRHVVRAVRSLLIADVAALLWLRGSRAPTHEPGLAQALNAAADSLEMPDSVDATDLAMAEVIERVRGDDRLARALADMADALRKRPRPGESLVESLRVPSPVVLHRDWVGAREASVRSGAMMLLVGALWLVTQWTVGPFLLLGTAIMTSLFSTFDNPARFMGNVLVGSALGAIGALACRWLVWPHVGGEISLVATMIPFILIGVPISSHRRTMPFGFDYNMVLLLLSQPAYPLSGSFLHSLAIAAAVCSGPVTGYFAYRMLFPVDAHRRMDTLVVMMVHELATMAHAPDGVGQRRIWRARLYHRLLRLVRWAEKSGQPQIAMAEGSLAVLDLGSAVLRIREMLAEPGLSPGTARRLDTVLRRLGDIGRTPDRLARDLQMAALRLTREGRAEAAWLSEVASSVTANRGFFLRAGRSPQTGPWRRSLG